MEDLSNIHYVSLLGFCVALVFGFVGNKTHFCTMGAVSDVVNMGSKGRLGSWFMAIGIAVIGAQLLSAFEFVNLGESMYLSTQFLFLSYILGGFIFGIGMTLGAGCGQRSLVRVGGGNLKSLVVVIVLGVTAYMTLRGILALLRINYIYEANIELTDLGMQSQSLPQAVSALTGISDGTGLQIAVAMIIGIALIAYAIKQVEFRTNFDNVLAGITVGGCVLAAWFITGYLGKDDFDPISPQGLTFIGPTGNTISYLMTFTGAQINFGIAVTFGMILGSFIYAVISRTFRIETFSNKSEMVGHLIGGAMMGFGGVLAFGCTIGQGVTGVSTLAIGSYITLVMIIFGSALTMKVQYHMLDDRSFISAAAVGAYELLNPFHKE